MPQMIAMDVRISTLAIVTMTLFSLKGLAQSRQTVQPDRSHLPPINLTSVIQNAVSSNPASLGADQHLAIARAEKELARSNLLPSVSGGVQYDWSQNPEFLGFGQTRADRSGLTLSQNIFNLPAVLSFRAAKSRMQAASAEQQGRHARLASQVSGTYFDLLRLRISLDLAEENLDSMRALLATFHQDPMKTKANAVDIQLVEATIASTENIVRTLTKEARLAELQLQLEAGIQPERFYLEEPPALRIPTDEAAAWQMALSLNPDLQASQSQVLSSKLELKSAQKRNLPQISGVGSGYYSHRPNTPEFGSQSQPGVSVGVRVTIPVFDSSRKPTIAMREAQLKQAELQGQAQQQNLQIGLAKTYIQIQERNSAVRSLCQSLQSRLGAFEKMGSELLSSVTTQDYLFQKQELFKTALSLNAEFLSTHLDTYQVHAQIGSLITELPAPTRPDQVTTPNAYYYGLDVYRRLLNRCANLVPDSGSGSAAP